MKSIHIVDNNRDNTKLLKDILYSRGYHVYENTNGRDAYEEILEEQPDLVLTEIMVPGMNGHKLTRLLRKNQATKHVPIMAITACALKGDRKKALRAGFSMYMAKPIDTTEFVENVEYLIGPAYEPVHDDWLLSQPNNANHEGYVNQDIKRPTQFPFSY